MRNTFEILKRFDVFPITYIMMCLDIYWIYNGYIMMCLDRLMCLDIYTHNIQGVKKGDRSALARLLYNLQKSFFLSGKDEPFSFQLSPFL